MRWDITGCANPWDEFIQSDSLTTNEYHQIIFDYLSIHVIDVKQVTSYHDSSKVELCYACHCKTGDVILITLSNNDKSKLKCLAKSNQFDLEFY